jgi:hypothetical protein
MSNLRLLGFSLVGIDRCLFLVRNDSFGHSEHFHLMQRVAMKTRGPRDECRAITRQPAGSGIGQTTIFAHPRFVARP